MGARKDHDSAKRSGGGGGGEGPAGLTGPALIITDGSIAGFLCCWAEGVARPPESPRPRDGADTGGPVAWIDPRATAAGAAAALASASVCQLVAAVPGRLGLDVDVPTTLPGLRETGVLLAAGVEALRRGISRIVWPVQVGSPGTDQASLDAIADAFDRSLLAARLLSVDARSADVRIETPLIDLSDAQLMDLAADMDAPLASACWCQAATAALEPACGKCVSCRRWLSAAKAVGLPMEDLSAATAAV